MKHVELLAPAGTMEAFEGAVNAGADAVYLAGRRFGARAYAENFSDEELREVIRTAHLCGVKVHLTVNTLMRGEELAQIPSFLYPLAEEGLDGIIVQDLGVLRLVHQELPELALHASTQLSVTTPDAVRYLAEMGVTRVVPARELNLAEIRHLRDQVPVELETFIHGAMCYCYSGKCLFSSFLGGRSGNRGRCAQTCRLPYTVLGKDGRPEGTDAAHSPCYPLSMRDMCTLTLLPELVDAGINSFKIEGRMKKPEYAAGVTHVYRKYLDRYEALKKQHQENVWHVDPEDLENLKQLYLRTELSNGYYHEYNGRKLITISQPGYRGTDESRAAAVREKYVHPIKNKAGVHFTILMKTGQPAELLAEGRIPEAHGSAETQSAPVRVTVRGETVQSAANRPLTEEQIEHCLRKSGNTVFAVEGVNQKISGMVFLPVSSLNALRRAALSELEEQLLSSCRREHRREFRALQDRIMSRARQAAEHMAINGPAGGSGADEASEVRNSSVKSIEASLPDSPIVVFAATAAQGRAASNAGNILLVDDSMQFALRDRGAFLALPYAIRARNAAWMEEALTALQEGRYCGAVVRNLEGLAYLERNGCHLPLIADHSLYCWNRQAMRAAAGVQLHVLSVEQSGKELITEFKDCLAQSACYVYGRIPMMISAGCVRKTENCCVGKEDGFFALYDRRNQKFPVRTICSLCQNVIYNSVPLSLHRFTEEPILRGSRWVLSFTTETPAETEKIVSFYQNQRDGRRAGDFPESLTYTTGHFRKGAV